MKKHKRYNFCEDLEREIQRRAKKKDYRLWCDPLSITKYIPTKHPDINVYQVNGEWIRNNLSVLFGHGGHGYVHEFIPLDEIWVDPKHYHNKNYDCGCTKHPKDFLQTLIKHEIAERNEMARGTPFWKAHQIALKKEKE